MLRYTASREQRNRVRFDEIQLRDIADGTLRNVDGRASECLAEIIWVVSEGVSLLRLAKAVRLSSLLLRVITQRAVKVTAEQRAHRSPSGDLSH